MPSTPDDKAGHTPAGYIPHPPKPADIDQVSQDQALITDEWADSEPAPHPAPDAGPAPDAK